MDQKEFDIMQNKDGFIAAGSKWWKYTQSFRIMAFMKMNIQTMKRCSILFIKCHKNNHFTFIYRRQNHWCYLFEHTMNNKIEDKYTGDYLKDKGIVPFIKIDKGLADIDNGVQLMKPMPELDSLLKQSVDRGMFGTKMRSNILEYNEEGIDAVVKQQFEVAYQIIDAGLVPIIEPEVNIAAKDKEKIEAYLQESIQKELDQLNEDQFVMLKLTIPTEPIYIKI